MPRAKCGKSTERTVDFYLTEYTIQMAVRMSVMLEVQRLLSL